MKRLKWVILVFFLVLTVPLAWLIWRTYVGLEQEEAAQFRLFAGALFDQMETELALLVQREEARSLDDFQRPGSPLTRPAAEKYILGYLQNNPDGSLLSPLIQPGDQTPDKIEPIPALVDQLRAANQAFNARKTAINELDVVLPPASQRLEGEKASDTANKFFDISKSKKRKDSLGQDQKRVEQLTSEQASNLARQSVPSSKTEAKLPALPAGPPSNSSTTGRDSRNSPPAIPEPSARQFQTMPVEVDPLQPVYLGGDQVFLFRRVVVGPQVYRQGLIIKLTELQRHLTATYFQGQPMAGFAELSIDAVLPNGPLSPVRVGKEAVKPAVTMSRNFPRPFGFLRARLVCDRVPPSPGRTTLTIMVATMAAVILAGLAFIYRTVRATVDLAERRAGFVSSVTHELKTPLANIRLYIDLLEQGLAPDPEKEQEYFHILGLETARLSRLINNVLEFSKLEKKQRPLTLQAGQLSETIDMAREIMAETIRLEGFTLKTDIHDLRPVRFDREVMVQVLVNLLENSIKFGKKGPGKEIVISLWPDGPRSKLMVADSGPGIPEEALKKVFDDFYRVDNSLTRTTSGTGLGLALVKKYITAMGGQVIAANNPHGGCTITVILTAVSRGRADPVSTPLDNY